MAKNSGMMELIPETFQLDFLNLLTDYSPITVKAPVNYKKNNSTNVKSNPPKVLGLQYFGIVDKEQNFEAFIESESNTAAITALMSLLNPKQAKPSSLQVIYLEAHSGLGKTHLLHAMANQLLKDKRAFYLSTAFQMNNTPDNLSALNNYEYFLIDDIEDMESNPEAQKLLCQLLDQSFRGKMKIVITALKPIHEINCLSERLKNKLCRAMQINIRSMDKTLIEKFINQKAEHLNLTLNDFQRKVLINKNPANGHSLLGGIANFKNLLDLNLYHDEIEFLNNQTNLIDYENAVIDSILKEVSSRFNIDQKMMFSGRREKEYIIPRHVAMFVLKDKIGLSLNQIGKLFNKDHTTVIYAVEKIKKLIKKDAELKALVQSV